jgi:hypothetical protein
MHLAVLDLKCIDPHAGHICKLMIDLLFNTVSCLLQDCLWYGDKTKTPFLNDNVY